MEAFCPAGRATIEESYRKFLLNGVTHTAPEAQTNAQVLDALDYSGEVLYEYAARDPSNPTLIIPIEDEDELTLGSLLRRMNLRWPDAISLVLRRMLRKNRSLRLTYAPDCQGVAGYRIVFYRFFATTGQVSGSVYLRQLTGGFEQNQPLDVRYLLVYQQAYCRNEASYGQLEVPLLGHPKLLFSAGNYFGCGVPFVDAKHEHVLSGGETLYVAPPGAKYLPPNGYACQPVL